MIFLSLALAAPVDWGAVGDETVQLLAEYLRIDTVNPPGNETAGAVWMAAVLARDGIPSRIVEFAPGRGSLVARLEGTGSEPPLCLLSHIDVVPSEAERWPEGRAPLSGAIAEGAVWGRGALDMKGMGALELSVFLQLARQEIPLRRDVVLLAVADEEVAGGGIRSILAEWRSIGCSQVVNEGGLGIRDLFFPGQTVYGVSVAEKGILWGRMIASGPAGHGSRPDPDQAPAVLARAVSAIQASRSRPRVHASLWELFDAVGRPRAGLTRMVLTTPALARVALMGRLLRDSATRAVLTDTINVTGFGGGRSTNVVPGEVWATLDCRLLPGTTPDAMKERLRALVPDPAVRFEFDHEFLANESPTGDSLYESLVRHAVDGQEDAVAGPVLSVGFTDSLYLRPLGVHAYGFVPFAVTLEEAAAMHGHGEHVSIDNVHRGVKVLFDSVVEVVQHSSLAAPGVPASKLPDESAAP